MLYLNDVKSRCVQAYCGNLYSHWDDVWLAFNEVWIAGTPLPRGIRRGSEGGNSDYATAISMTCQCCGASESKKEEWAGKRHPCLGHKVVHYFHKHNEQYHSSAIYPSRHLFSVHR